MISSRNAKDWIMVVAFAVFTGVFLGAVESVQWPTCSPSHGGGIVIGGTMLMGGCQ